MRLRLITQLALRDLWFDRKVSFFVISALVAVIAPLLLLFSLKFGIVSQLQQQLLNDPQNLEIKINGMQSNKVLDNAWFEQMKTNPKIKFIIPLTRSLNMLADLRKDSQHFANSIELIPTADGDPLVPNEFESISKNKKTQIILTRTLAEKLSTHLGDELILFIGRKLDGQEQREKISVQVAGILPESAFTRPAAFISLELLIAIEDYRDGFQISQFVAQPTDGNPLLKPRESFAKARIYAESLDDVSSLAQQLRLQGIDTQTQSKAIENVKAIDKVLSTLFIIIAITSIIGCILSLSGSFLANIERKRKEISLLSLFGLERDELKIYLVVQGFILASLSFFIACLFFFIGSLIINSILGQHLAQNSFVSQLLISHVIIAFLSTLFLSCLVALVGGQQATKIQPAESLRDA